MGDIALYTDVEPTGSEVAEVETSTSQNVFIKDTTLTSIADAIRSKTGETGSMKPAEMAGKIEGISADGGSGLYVWTKQGMSSTLTLDSTAGTCALINAENESIPIKIEYLVSASGNEEPVYDNLKRQWNLPNSTIMSINNINNTLPDLSEYGDTGYVYVRLLSEPNIFYTMILQNGNGFSATLSGSNYTKNFTYTNKRTATTDITKKYITSSNLTEYPNQDWSIDGYYYEIINNTDIQCSYNNSYTVTSGDFDGFCVANNVCFAYNTSSAADNPGGLCYSNDSGLFWEQTSFSSDSKKTFVNNLCYGNGIYVITHYNNGFYYSLDGITWTQSNITSTGSFLGSTAIKTYINNIFLANTENTLIDEENNYTWLYPVYYSEDGKNWISNGIEAAIVDIKYINNLYIITTNHGVYYSIDGKVWTQSNITVSSNYIDYDNQVLVVGTNQGLYYSIDGKNWIQSNVIKGVAGICYKGNIWVANSGGALYYSNDGKKWYLSNIDTDAMANTFFYYNGMWITGYKSYINMNYYYSFQSYDGKTWEKTNIYNLETLEFINNTFFAIVDFKIKYSNDAKHYITAQDESIGISYKSACSYKNSFITSARNNKGVRRFYVKAPLEVDF